jgi:hypothetical protein
VNGRADGEKSEHSNSLTSPWFLFELEYPWYSVKEILIRKKRGPILSHFAFSLDFHRSAFFLQHSNQCSFRFDELSEKLVVSPHCMLLRLAGQMGL